MIICEVAQWQSNWLLPRPESFRGGAWSIQPGEQLQSLIQFIESGFFLFDVPLTDLIGRQFCH